MPELLFKQQHSGSRACTLTHYVYCYLTNAPRGINKILEEVRGRSENFCLGGSATMIKA